MGLSYQFVDDARDWRASGVTPQGFLIVPAYHWITVRKKVHDGFSQLMIFIGGMN